MSTAYKPTSCCNRTAPSVLSGHVEPANIIEQVNKAYSAKAREGVTNQYAKSVAEAFGYTEEELKSVPEGSHMGLSCGNPVATAHIKEGETVVDLGSGGGIDIFLAATKVGPTGKAIGLDMSADMIALARKNAAQKGLKPPHVAFVETMLTEPLPINSNSTDCILSNCVINLLPPEGKGSVLKEAHRILKPGGRIVLDDIVLKKPLLDNIKSDLASYVGCIAGAISVEEYEVLLKEAGFSNVLLVDTKNDLAVYFTDTNSSPGCCSTSSTADPLIKKPDYDLNEWAGSYQIYALKAGEPTETPESVLTNWWIAYPTVKSAPSPVLSDEDVVALIRSAKGTATDNFAVIDVRRNDHAGGHVRGSHNWPAQTFYDDLASFFEKFKNVPKLIFYCNSSAGRGPRCAGWYQDYLNARVGEHNSAAYILKGGVKNWIEKYDGQEDLVDRD